MKQKLQELRSRLTEVSDLRAAEAILYWDQATYLPPGAAEARGRQMATLSRIAHERFVDPVIGRLLEDLQPYEESLPYDSDDAALLRVTRRDYERQTRVPASFVAEWTDHKAGSYNAWTRARPENDFRGMEPYLEKMLDYSRRYSEFFPGYDHIGDPLIAIGDYGMKAESVRSLFSQLREALVPLVSTILGQAPVDDTCLRQSFTEEGQESFFQDVIRAFGYDYHRGRHDVTAHPFTTSFATSDVRITVRYRRDYLGDAIFSAFHEAGHAMYEQGINAAYDGTPLARGTSSGVHESQSRLWENLVGRSRGFWQQYYPRLQVIFPRELGTVPLDSFYRAINKVEQSLIRTDADEVTYNLHVMIRFDLELALLEGVLSVRDLAEAWNARYESDLGIVPPDHRDGVLQDVHWYYGRIGGMFQGYTLGNILSALFYDAALQDHPDIPDEIEEGRFDTLHTWLRKHIYQHGRKYTAEELVQRVTGGPLRIQPYVDYLRGKYDSLYDL